MNTKELLDKLREIKKNNDELKYAHLVLRCFDKEGKPQDIDIYDMRHWIQDNNTEIYCMENFIMDDYEIKRSKKED